MSSDDTLQSAQPLSSLFSRLFYLDPCVIVSAAVRRSILVGAGPKISAAAWAVEFSNFAYLFIKISVAYSIIIFAVVWPQILKK